MIFLDYINKTDESQSGEVFMTTCMFYLNGDYKTVEAESEEQAIKEAGIEAGDAYDLVETDSFDDKCLLSANTDEILFGS
jgi:hypothetical protein